METNKEQDCEVKEKYLHAQIQELEEKNQELEEKNQELSNELKEMKKVTTCIVCSVDKISTVCAPCGHACLCENCLETMRGTDAENPERTIKCPLCRRQASGNKLHLDLLKLPFTHAADISE